MRFGHGTSMGAALRLARSLEGRTSTGGWSTTASPLLTGDVHLRPDVSSTDDACCFAAMLRNLPKGVLDSSSVVAHMHIPACIIHLDTIMCCHIVYTASFKTGDHGNALIRCNHCCSVLAPGTTTRHVASRPHVFLCKPDPLISLAGQAVRHRLRGRRGCGAGGEARPVGRQLRDASRLAQGAVCSMLSFPFLRTENMRINCFGKI